jgi:hypothetical protein
MLDNSQTIKGNTVTLGTPAIVAGSLGNGTCLVDKVLDGFSVPLSGGFSHIRYNGLNSELAVPSETMQLVCTADSFTGGTQEGAESWSLTGGPAFPLFNYHAEGSGQGGSIKTAHGDTTIQNFGFDAFTTNTPQAWTITGGLAGTDVFKETTNVHRGAAALKFLGTGSAKPAISQAVAASKLKPRRRYLCTIMAYVTGTPGAGNLTIKFTGTGYTASSSEKIDIALTSLTGSYALYKFYLNVPATIPPDLALTIAVTGTNLGNAAAVYLDSGSFSPVQYFGGINATVVSGTAPWVVGDRINFTVANNSAGKFQEFFRRWSSAQLPSKTDGSESINDALAS